MLIQTLRLLIVLICCLVHSSTQGQTSSELTLPPSTKPNIIVILSDDQGFGDFSFTGNESLKTPHIDSLARDGAFLSNFYVCPVCSPTRAEFLTGRYHLRDGVVSTSSGGERLSLKVKTIADVLSKSGYATGAFGKWHNGMQPPYHPICRGFDHFYGFCSGHWGHYFSPPLDRNNEIAQGDGYLPDDLTNQALRFIDQQSALEKPFFVYLALNTPHSPMQVPDQYWKQFKDVPLGQQPGAMTAEEILHNKAALAMCKNLDDNVGRVIAKLESLKAADDTVVIYFCDNGPNGNRFNGGLKGIKGSTDEGGVKSPLFLRWPNGVKAGQRIPTIAGAIDLLPTLVEIAGGELREQAIDGVSLMPLLGDAGQGRATDDSIFDRTIFSHWRGNYSARDGRYRLDATGRVYDLSNDPGQRWPLLDHPAKQRLSDQLEVWKRDLPMSGSSMESPFTVGHPRYRNTQLPARDAIATGRIRRSNRYPNASYFTNWVDVNDTISWSIDVIKAGRFEVEIYGDVADENRGAAIELRCGDSSISGKFDVVSLGAAYGSDEDRVKRKESLVKDFQTVKIGEIYLPQGLHRLELKTKRIIGTASIEFSTMMLRRMRD